MATRAQLDAVRGVLATAGTYSDVEDLAGDLCQAALVGDVGLRWCVITRDPRNNVNVFGPYASRETAVKFLNSGALASVEGTKGGVFPMSVGRRFSTPDSKKKPVRKARPVRAISGSE